MKLYKSVDDLPSEFESGAITIGNFDGVHRGHKQLIQRLVARAKEFSGPAVVFTFDPHPVQLLRPEAAPVPLTWVERKADLLAGLGVDCVIAYPTDRKFLSLSPEAYFREIIVGKLRAKSVVEGPNFFFGKDRAGTTEVLAKLCEAHSVAFEVVTPIESGGELVSSSRIRAAIAGGDIESANKMLTQPYRIRGTVTNGAGRGAKIGFPTANLSEIATLLPDVGVYAGAIRINAASDTTEKACETAAIKKAAINIGPNPTFGDRELKVEVHILDFDQSIYGETLAVDFLKKLRDVQSFDSLPDLQEQLQRDISAVRNL